MIKAFIGMLCISLLVSSKKNTHSNKAKIIMAVFAHADDEINVSPLLNHYASLGYKVYLVIATKGELGIREHVKIPAGDSLAAARITEAKCVCTVLGIEPPVFLGLGDESLVKDFTGAPLSKKLDSIFALYQPDAVITWGPGGGYGHTDHRMVHNIVTELFQSGRNRWPKQLYYTEIPTENLAAMPTLKEGVSRYITSLWKTVKKDYLPIRVSYTNKEMDAAMRSIDCYKSQFSDGEMEDNKTFLKYSNNDTVYLRPYYKEEKRKYDIFE